jgi:hypothetical protein
VACIKLAPIGNGFAAGYARAVACKFSPTDVLAEEGPVFSFEPLYLAPGQPVAEGNLITPFGT